MRWADDDMVFAPHCILTHRQFVGRGQGHGVFPVAPPVQVVRTRAHRAWAWAAVAVCRWRPHKIRAVTLISTFCGRPCRPSKSKLASNATAIATICTVQHVVPSPRYFPICANGATNFVLTPPRQVIPTPYSASFSIADLSNQQQGIDGEVSSFTSLLFDELLTLAPAWPEAHRTSSRPLRPLWVSSVADWCRLQKALRAIWQTGSIQPRRESKTQHVPVSRV